MAYNPLDSNILKVGDPTKKEIFDTLKSNGDDLDSRLADQEAGASKIIVFNDFVRNAMPGALGINRIFEYKAQNPFTLIDAKLYIYDDVTAGRTGILELDVLKSNSFDPTSFVTVFTTKPSVDLGTASDYAQSVNAAFDPGQVSIAAGDILQVRATSLFSPVSPRFFISVVGEI